MKASFKILIVIGFALSSSVAVSEDYYVHFTLGSGTICSKAQPCATIEQAYTSVNTPDDIINVAQGSYTFSAQFCYSQAFSLYGGYNDDFSVRDPEIHETILSSTNNRVFCTRTGLVSWNLYDGITFNGTNITNSSGVVHSYDTGALIRMNNVKFSNNFQGNGGGAIEMNIAGSQLEITNSQFINNTATDEGGAIEMNVGTKLTVSDSLFSSNSSSGADGGAIYIDQAEATILTSNFILNNANGNGGAIYVSNDTKEPITIQGNSFEQNSGNVAGALYSGTNNIINVENNSFSENTANSNAGAIAFQRGLVRVINNTFYRNVADADDNSSSRRGGAINFGGFAANSHATVAYNTFYQNEVKGTSSLGGGLHINNNAGAANIKLAANIFFDNIADTGPNVSDLDKIVDAGNNLFGFNGNAGIYGTTAGAITDATNWSAQSSTAATPDLTTIIETDLNDNGGLVKTLKLVNDIDSPAIDAVDNQYPTFFGQGQSAAYPFTSLSQAYGAIKFYESYTAGIYYFDLEGVYGSSDENYAFTAGSNPDAIFSTYVDDNGWVLIAAGTSSIQVTAPYAQVSALTLESDSILAANILAELDMDEARISSGDTSEEPFEAVSRNENVLTSIRTNKMLPNNYDNSLSPILDTAQLAKYGLGGWVYTIGRETYGDDSLLSCLPGNSPGSSGVEYDLPDLIFHNCGNSIVWSPNVFGGEESLIYSGNQSDARADSDLNLWVRSATGLCDGSLTTVDSRGMPRPDFKNTEDPDQVFDVNLCDLGAFEYNNGYQFDCYDEDGDRPGIEYSFNATTGIQSAEATFCLGGNWYTDASPQAVLNSLGSLNAYLFSFMMLLFFARGKR